MSLIINNELAIALIFEFYKISIIFCGCFYSKLVSQLEKI